MKVANSYATLLRGVSQQTPGERAEGQHTEQVNLLSDPVNGLTRRRGTEWLAETIIGTTANYPATEADTRNWTTFDFDTGGKEYVVLMRRNARTAGSAITQALICYNKTDKAFLNVVSAGADTGISNGLSANGVAAATAVGKYLFLAQNEGASTSSVASSPAPSTTRAVAWVRGGAYARTYTIKATMQSGVVRTATYTTPTSSYQGTLVTSDIPATATDYTKQVNDRVNAYNSAVTAWIGTAAAAIQPAAIAAQLASAMATAGKTITLSGSTLCFDVGDGSPAQQVSSLEVDDGGDGSLLYGVAQEVGDVAKLSTVHYAGKVVKVRSGNDSNGYYMKAVPKVASATGFTEVTWTEGTLVTQSITGGIYLATIVGNIMYVASTPAYLTSITPGPHPTFEPSTVGDLDSDPVPYWVGRQISWLGTFQNRLLVGSGGVVTASKIDDYLNFFRSTVLTLPADDPFEMQPTGSDDDVIRQGVLYDQDLVLFGNKRQYVISGQVALSPTSANMRVMASYEASADAAPVSAGGFVFYAKRGKAYSTIHQIQPGQTENSPESFPASSQLDDYIAAGAVELASITGMPSFLLVRTNSNSTANALGPNNLYVFSYLDRQDGRKMDSWSRWEFDYTACGALCGMTVVPDGAILFSLRKSSNGLSYMVADFASIVTTLSSKPYLDSNRPYAQVLAGTGSTRLDSGNNWAAAYDATNERRFSGQVFPATGSFTTPAEGVVGLTVGALTTAYVVPTSPFMRDGKDNPILSGRLTITKKTVAFKDSSGFDAELTYRTNASETTTFNGRVLGDPTNVIGREPVSTGQRSIPIGRESRDYTLAIKARRWFPLTITGIEWVGQFFNRVNRF